jgi:hypothetical protein
LVARGGVALRRQHAQLCELGLRGRGSGGGGSRNSLPEVRTCVFQVQPSADLRQSAGYDAQ